MNADAVAERINKSYTKEFNSINAAVDAADEDDELALRRCCTRARALLAELTIPLYHRIKTLLLLASIVDDVDEASEFLQRAERQVGVARDHEARFDNVNTEAEEAIVELEGTVEKLRGFLAEEVARDAKEYARDIEEAASAEDDDEEMEIDDDHPDNDHPDNDHPDEAVASKAETLEIGVNRDDDNTEKPQ